MDPALYSVSDNESDHVDAWLDRCVLCYNQLDFDDPVGGNGKIAVGQSLPEFFGYFKAKRLDSHRTRSPRISWLDRFLYVT